MRTEHLEKVAGQVNAYHMKAQVDYDYFDVRKRKIFEALTEGVFYVFNNAVEGNIAEFGTAWGFSAYTIARAMSAYSRSFDAQLKLHGVPQKTLELFDSFEGLPKATNQHDVASPNVQAGRWGEGGFKGLTTDELLALCGTAYPRERIRIVPGWYSQSLSGIAPDAKYAMLHLDCDLYSSTLEVLDYLFAHNHVADGCVLFFDDWNCNRASPRFGQRRAWREITEKHHLNFSDCGDYAMLGHKFLVHQG